MKFLKTIFFSLWAVLFAGEQLAGQSLPFKLYTPHDGLPQSQIVSMFQDSRGYLWIGTKGGLAYFDGVRFHAFGAKEELPNLHISYIQEDSTGNVIFFTGKWLCKYDGRSITYDTLGLRIHEGFFCIDNSQTMWGIEANDRQLYFREKGKGWKPASEKWPQFAGKKWNDLRFDRPNNRLLLNDTEYKALYSLKDGNEPKVLSNKFHLLAGLNNSEIFKGFGFRADSIFEVRENDCQFWGKGIGGIAHGVKRKSGDFFFTNLWGKNLYRIDPSGKLHTDSIGVSSSFLFLDRDDNLWVAAEQGLVRVFPDGFKNFGKHQLDGVWSIAEDAEGSMWFGEYYSQKLKRYDGSRIEQQRVNYAIKKGMAVGDFSQFYFGGGRDKSGNLYFPNGGGVLKFDGKRYSFLDKTQLSFNFYLDTLKNILVSGEMGGANVIDLKTGATRFFGKEKGLFKGGNVLGVAKDGTGKYWLGTGSRLAVLDLGRDSIVKNYARDLGNFPWFGTIDVLGDFRGNLWVGTAKALLFHDLRQDSFIEVAPNIIRTQVNSLAVYKDQFLVIGASDGIYFLDLKAFYEGGKTIVRHFNQYNGYIGIEPDQNCLFVDSKGNIWVAASDIVTKIAPSELDMTPHPLGLFITEINNERVRFEDYGKVIALPGGINTAKIRFEAVGFERPRETEFSYKTDGGKWSEWRTEDFAILDNLSSGTYTFHVRTRPAGTVNEAEIKESSIQIKVNAPLLKEWWFPWLAGAGFSALVGWAVFYVRRTRRQKVEQEERDRERIRQIRYLQIQTLQAQLNPHFIFNVLQAIQTRIYEEDRETASGLIVNLAHLIRQFLESSINMDFSRGRDSEITVAQEISLLKNYIEFEQLQYTDKFDYGIHFDESLDIENIHVPPMLIQPYVENAIKYGILYEKERRCRVDVRFTKTDDDRLVITIADNGVGRTRAKEIQKNYIRMYKSRGTQLIEERIKIMQELGLGVSVVPDENPVGGTLITLTIDF